MERITPAAKKMAEDHIAANKRITAGVLAFMFALLWSVVALIGYVMGATPWVSLVIGSVVAAIYIWVSMSFSVEAVIRATEARPVNPERREEKLLQYRVEEMAIAAGLPVPKVYVQDSRDINAFATGLRPEASIVCVTTGALELLNQEELEGVIAHEMSHILNRDMRVATITLGVVGAIALMAEIAFRVAFRGGGRRNQAQVVFIVLALVLIALAPIFSRMAYFFLSRRREYLADATGAMLTRNPEGLAGALAKIHGDVLDDPRGSRTAAGLYLSNPWVKLRRSSVWSTHPPLEDRIARLKGM